jgi:hypothetical protein
LAELLLERTSPELAYLETKFAALASYGLTLKVGLAQQRYVKSHRNLFRSPRFGPHPGTPYRPILEHVHAFTRAVWVGNPREFLQAEKEDQEMAEGCKRLIKHCIVC